MKKLTFNLCMSIGLLTACGSDGDGGAECGAGTTLTNGVCVADGGGADCGPGTMLMDGACVVIPDVDVPEGDFLDSKDDEAPTEITLAAIGDSVTVSGCLEADENGDQIIDDLDWDFFLFNIPSNSVLEVRGQGLNGSAFGYVLGNLGFPDYVRQGVVDGGSDVTREQFTPGGTGDYVFIVRDSRDILQQTFPRAVIACYTAELEVKAAPTAAEALGDPSTGGINTIAAYTYDSGAAGTASQVTLAVEEDESVSLPYASLLDDSGTYAGELTVGSNWVYGQGPTTIVVDAARYIDATDTFVASAGDSVDLLRSPICPSAGGTGTVVTLTGVGMLNPADEGYSSVITLPFTYSHFGTDKTELVVVSNGAVTFDTSFNAESWETIPEALPATESDLLDFIAPFWADLDGIEVCTSQTASELTIEWRGAEFGFFAPGPPVSFQLILADDGSATAYFDVSHEGAAGLIGHQNAAGDEGVNSPDAPVPNSEQVITALASDL